MKLLLLLPLLISGVLCQRRRGGLAQGLTSVGGDSNGLATPVYIPKAGKISRITAPTATPTLVYNCYNMPLICENVASYLKSQGNGNGDLDGSQLFYFDPDQTNRKTRQKTACGNFPHDTCATQTSRGKRFGQSIADISATNPDPNLERIQDFERAIIAAGFNPTQGQERVPYEFPGRFAFQGVAYSCDEFPAATFIEGGDNANTICALHNWKIYTGRTTPGKWLLMPEMGKQQEQDWQGLSHDSLRNSFGIRSGQGLGTVYPFHFTTTTLTNTQSKAWVVKAEATPRVVHRRDDISDPVGARYFTTVITGEDGAKNRKRIAASSPGPDATTTTGPSSTTNQTSVTSSALTSVAPAAAAETASARVASASAAADVLAANPNNATLLAIVKKKTHTALNRAEDLAAAVLAGSALAAAVTTLENSLTTAAGLADSGAAAADIVSALKKAGTAAAAVEQAADDETKTQEPSHSTSPTTSHVSSTSSSSSATATTTPCEFTYECDGSEDPEVGDPEFDEYDPDDVGCMPIYGVGGSIEPCDSTISSSRSVTGAPTSITDKPLTSSPAQSTFETTTKSWRHATSTDVPPSPDTPTSSSTHRHRSRTSSSPIASPTSEPTGHFHCHQPRPNDSPNGAELLNSLTKNDQLKSICNAEFGASHGNLENVFNHGSIDITVERGSSSEKLTHCSKALDAIITTCIVTRGDYGGTYNQGDQHYNISNTIYPANPLVPGGDEGAPPVSSDAASPPTATTAAPAPPPPAPAPPTPTQIRFNKKGSGICPSIGGGACQNAYHKYNDTWLYTDKTSYTADSANYFWGAGGFNDGCTAIFVCDNDAAYAVGMTGAQIKAAFDNFYGSDGGTVCGSSYLSNQCHITTNGCNNCGANVPCGALPAEALAANYGGCNPSAEQPQVCIDECVP